MLDMATTAADTLGQVLTDEFKRTFGSGRPTGRSGLAQLHALPAFPPSRPIRRTVAKMRLAIRSFIKPLKPPTRSPAPPECGELRRRAAEWDTIGSSR